MNVSLWQQGMDTYTDRLDLAAALASIVQLEDRDEFLSGYLDGCIDSFGVEIVKSLKQIDPYKRSDVMRAIGKIIQDNLPN